jgi:hypothetical protein
MGERALRLQIVEYGSITDIKIPTTFGKAAVVSAFPPFSRPSVWTTLAAAIFGTPKNPGKFLLFDEADFKA